MKKFILTFITMLLAGVNTVWGQNVAKIGSTEYATLQAAIDAVPTDGTETTITFIAANTTVSGNGFQIPDGTTGKNIIIDFNGCTYTVTGGAVGSTGYLNQCMHFEADNTLKLKNGSINVQANLTAVKIMMQNYCNLTLDGFNVDCSNVITQTYSGYTGDDAIWNGKTRPKFNFNAGTSTIKNSTITFGSEDQFGVLTDKEGTAANLAIDAGTTINGNVTALGGNATIEGDNITITGNVLVDKVETNQSQGSITINSGTIQGSATSTYGTLTIPTTSTATFPNAVAKIGDNQYFTTLQEAIDAVPTSGATATEVLLLKDITVSESIQIPSSKKIILNLGEKTLTSAVNNTAAINFETTVTGTELTIKNGTINYSGDHSVTAIRGNNNNVVIDTDAILNATNAEGEAAGVVVVNGDGNNLTVMGTVTTAGKGSNEDANAIGTNGSNTTNATVTIKEGAVITSAQVAAVYLSGMSSVTMNIEGGTITGATGVYQKSGTLNISGGTITGNGADVDPQYHNNGGKSTGDALIIDNCQGYDGTPVANITGGTFISTNRHAIESVAMKSSSTYTGEPIKNFVSGGTFNKEIALSCCKEGYFSKGSGSTYTLDGPYDAKINETGYAAFADAATAAGTEGTTTIDLLRDITTAYTLAEGQKLMIQDNGYSITIKAPEGYEVKKESTTTGITTYSVVKSINGATISVTIEPATYTGSTIEPKVTVKAGDETLVSGTDYTISLYPTTFTDAKTYSKAITITGMGNYGGIRKEDFTINQKPISECNISATAEYNNGEAITTYTVVVKNGNTTLEAGADKDYTYTVAGTYTNIGTYENVVTVTGHNNYTGTTTVDLVVGTGTSIADALVTATAIYNGQNQPPTVENIIVKVGDATLTANDYDVTIAGAASDYKDAKTYSNAITITAKGATYYGKVKANYVIEQCDLTNAKVKVTEDAKMVWTGNAIELKINATEGNNVTLKLVATEDDTSTTDVNEEVSYKLEANTDYTYTATPSPFLEAGEYTVTFEGRGNFKGTKQLTVHVEKVATNLTIEESQRFIIPGNNYTNFNISDIDFKVKDGDKELVKGTDYTVEIYPYDEDGTVATQAATAITKDGAIKVKFTGKGDYSGSKEVTAFLLNEYYPRGGKALGSNGTTALNTDIRLFIDNNSTLTAKLGNQTNDAVIASDLEVLTIKNHQDGWTARIPFKTGTEANDVTNFDIPLTGIEAGAFKNCTNLTGIDLFYVPTITEIENGAFEGCTNLRYIDLADAIGYTPTSLQRNIAASPFYGVPKQALVYLNGTTFKGENYVYKPGTGTGLDYYCELFKVYDDLSGNQTQYTEANDYKWAFENRHNFTAYTIENTRYMKAGQHYTVCLPYDLPTPEDVKVYTLEASSDKILGFKEVTPTMLGATGASNWLPIPYVLIPSVSGKLLNATNCIVHEFKDEVVADESKLNSVTSAGNTQFAMSGTMRYISGAEAEGIYIMQGDNTWKMIRGVNGYSSACVLPMRAYIKAFDNNGGARLMATFTDAEGSTTAIDGLQLDADDAQEVYDLQGRKVKSPIKGHVYIVNGRKMIYK